MRPNVTFSLVLGLLAAIAAWLWYLEAFDGRGVPERLWFYDLNTGKLFAAPIDQVPPIAAPSGDLRGAEPGTPAGVVAQVIRRDGQRTVGYLQTFTSEGQQRVIQARASGALLPEEVLLRLIQVAEVPTPTDAPQWHALGSPEGQRIAAIQMGQAIELP